MYMFMTAATRMSGAEFDSRQDVREAALIGVAGLFSDFLLFGPIERAKTAFSTAWIMKDVKENLRIDFFDAYRHG